MEAAPPHWLCPSTAASLLHALEAFFLSLKVPTPLMLRDLKMETFKSVKTIPVQSIHDTDSKRNAPRSKLLVG